TPDAAKATPASWSRARPRAPATRTRAPRRGSSEKLALAPAGSGRGLATMNLVKDTLVMIMAGGKGSRLGPLTIHRSKPGVPFAGRYRIVDFVLSNFVNSGYRRIYVLTQYMSSSLI